MNLYSRMGSGVIVEACLIHKDTIDDTAAWSNSIIIEEIDPIFGDHYVGLNVTTPDGKRRASEGSYVVKTNNKYFVIPGGTFRALYTETI